MKRKIQAILIFLGGINISLYTMHSQFISIVAADKQETKINKKHLEDSSVFFRDFFSEFPKLNIINIANYTKKDFNILKQCLENYFNTYKNNPIYLKQFLRNLSEKKLHNIIAMTNYFNMPELYAIARYIWVEKCIDNENLSAFETNPTKDPIQDLSFVNDIDIDIAQIIMQNILPQLYIEHIKNNIFTKKEIFTSEQAFSSVALNKNENLLAGGCYDQTIYIYNRTKKYGFTLKDDKKSGNIPILCLAFNPKNDTELAVGYKDNTIRLWDVSKKICTHILHGHSELISFLEFSPDGTLLASTSEDNTARIWDMKNKKCIHILKDSNNETFLKLSFTLNHKQLITASTGTISYWDLDTGKKIENKSYKTSFGELAINPHNSLIATDTKKAKIHLLRAKNHNFVIKLSGHNAYILSLQFFNDTILCSGSRDKTIRFWDILAQQYIKTLSHKNAVSLIRFSKDQSNLYSASEDGSICCWEIMSTQEKQIFDALKQYTTIPVARLIYLAWQLKQRNQSLDLCKYPHLQKIFDTYNSYYVTSELHKAIQKFLCIHLSIKK